MFPPEFSVSITVVCIAATFFVIFLIWHICSDFGCYNSHKGIEDRRQRFQKAVFNFQIAEKITVYVHQPIVADPVGPVSPGIPSHAFRKQNLRTIKECPDTIDAIESYPV